LTVSYYEQKSYYKQATDMLQMQWMYLATKTQGEGLQVLRDKLNSLQNVDKWLPILFSCDTKSATKKISYAQIPWKFMAHLSEPLISPVAVWKQLHLNQWFAKTCHKTHGKWVLTFQALY
jgi:hypothetical protein